MLKLYSICLISPLKPVSSILRTVWPAFVSSLMYWFPGKELMLQPSFCKRYKIHTLNKMKSITVEFDFYAKQYFCVGPTNLTRSRIVRNQTRSHTRSSFCKSRPIHQTAAEWPRRKKPINTPKNVFKQRQIKKIIIHSV